MDKQTILEYLADGSEICRACIDRAEKTGSAAAITSLLRLREIVNQPLNKVVEDGQAEDQCKFYYSCGYVVRSCSKDCDMYMPAT